MKKITVISSAIIGLLLLISSVRQPHKTVENMVLFKGGNFTTTDPQTDSVIVVKQIAPFLIDKDLVTVAEFEDFTQQSGYVTEAEKFGNSTIFDFQTHEWRIEEGADFRFPFGRKAEAAKPNHPVTQVSWNDALAYAIWKDKRLPTDIEWEFAAKNGGKLREKYPWGEELVENGKYKANTWQGAFPYINSVADGFLTTSPVGYFGTNENGLTDMGGNVWEWCQDAVLPTGRNAELDPTVRKVMRGGSFLCDLNVCHGFKIGSRSNSTAETAMVHTGFRCVKSITD